MQRRFYFIFIQHSTTFQGAAWEVDREQASTLGIVDHFRWADQDLNIQVVILRVCPRRPRDPEPVPVCSEELHGGHGQPAQTRQEGVREQPATAAEWQWLA